MYLEYIKTHSSVFASSSLSPLAMHLRFVVANAPIDL